MKIKKDKGEKKDFTEAHGRAWELLMRVAKRKSFQKDIQKIREKFEIPLGGFKEKPYDYEAYGYLSPNVIPIEWKKKISVEKFTEFFNELMDLTNKYELGFLKAYYKVFFWLVFYGLYILPEDIGPVVLQDMVKAKKEIKFGKLKENYVYPLALLINPYAKMNEIIDFVKTHSDKIENLQDKYKSKAPPFKIIRRRGPTAASKFVQRNRHKNRKNLTKLTQAVYNPSYDETKINKILYNFRKKER